MSIVRPNLSHTEERPTRYNDGDDHIDVKLLRRQHYCNVYDYIWQHDLIKLSLIGKIYEGEFRAYKLKLRFYQNLSFCLEIGACVYI